MRDQLEVYKKLRQNHQKEVRTLESRLQMEMNDHRRNLDREYDQQVHCVVVLSLFACLFCFLCLPVFPHEVGLIIRCQMFSVHWVVQI